MKKFACIVMAMAALLLVAAPIDAQTRKKAATRKATTTKTTTAKKKGTAGAAKKTATAAVKKPEAIDMGLSVKWCNMDLGASNASSAGKVYPTSTDVAALMGEGWRVPTKKELEELFDSTDKQIFVNQNGTPSYVEFTSKTNGAKIKFYFPKIVAQGPKVLSNPSNGGYLIFPGSQESAMVSIAAMPCNQQIKAKLKEVIRDYKLESSDMSKWPDEVKNAIAKVFPGLIVDNAFTYLGFAKIESGSLEGVQLTIRPVYKIDDED